MVLLDIIVFVVLGLAIAPASFAQMSANSLIKCVVGSTVLSGLFIVGYFAVL